ncbi:hypothetical protein [Micromonospora peucetia]|uniref:Uncharacterized protein n=1 Tax=Micromonospora peucetia TaxID=47871 RepID=A0A1C6V448_9ACTN|nr:hypothetical protein [Micromonospora peucetia]SCL61018.1 hypothetical protein GA0070608_2403 [Micromonospora peucetia]
MTTTAEQIKSYQRSWFPSHHQLTDAQRAERAELMRLASLSMPRPRGLTASQHAERRAALVAAAEPYRNPDLLRRVTAGDRPAEFRSRTSSYQAQIGRALDGVLSRRTTDARRDLAAALGRADHRRRMEAASALGRVQGRALARREHSAAILAALDRRTEAALERKRRQVPQGPIRLI